MTKTLNKFGVSADKVKTADTAQIKRFEQAVEQKVVKRIEARATQQKAALARARSRYVR